MDSIKTIPGQTNNMLLVGNLAIAFSSLIQLLIGDELFRCLLKTHTF